MSKKVAFITGVTGQDGAYLSELLLSKNYFVHGVKRRSSSFNTQRIEHLINEPINTSGSFKLHYGDITDPLNILRLINEIEPDEIYNLAAQSHVQVSFETPEYTARTDALGTLNILEAIRILGWIDKTRIYQASTSELYGKVQKFLNLKLLHFIHAVLMQLPKCMLFGLPKIIEKPITCLLQMEYFLTMKAQLEVKLL